MDLHRASAAGNQYVRPFKAAGSVIDRLCQNVRVGDRIGPK
jgi:hypothetical protein